MLALRAAWAHHESDGVSEPEVTERLLEFLEELAGLAVRNVLSRKLVWDSTLGWHAVRYYSYNLENGNIGRARKTWRDRTLYQNLEQMYRLYAKEERRQRGIDEAALEEDLKQTRERFLRDEKCRGSHRLSHGSA
jgi:hypothetical protein